MNRCDASVRVFVVAASALLMLAIAGPAAAVTVTWQTNVGVVQPGNIVGSFPPTITPPTPPSCPKNGSCINGGGQPWTTLPNVAAQQQGSLSLSQSQSQSPVNQASVNQASVNLATGQLQFQVHGLVLAGGNSIGTPGSLTSVVGTLICIVGTTASPTNVVINTPVSVPLSSSGDAQFSGSVGPIQTPCSSSNIAFLIRTSVTGNWIANGSVRTSGP